MVHWTGLQSVIVELNPVHIHLLFAKDLNVSVPLGPVICACIKGILVITKYKFFF